MDNAYASAALRMRAHAESIFTDPRLGTADHLFGLAAECALKAILHASAVIPAPPDVPEDKATKKRFSTHIDKLWGEYVTWAAEGSAPWQLTAASSFDSGRAHDRYLHDDFFKQPRVDAHRVALPIYWSGELQSWDPLTGEVTDDQLRAAFGAFVDPATELFLAEREVE